MSLKICFHDVVFIVLHSVLGLVKKKRGNFVRSSMYFREIRPKLKDQVNLLFIQVSVVISLPLSQVQ